MEGVTLFISIAGCVLIFWMKPIYGLAVYVAAMAWYPPELTLKLGTIDFNVCRIIIVAICIRMFIRAPKVDRFKFIWLDRFVVIYLFCQVLVSLTRMPFLMVLESRGGAMFDTVLPYFAVRMVVTTKQRYLELLKSILLISAPLAFLGLYQSVTGHNVAGFLRKYAAWGNTEQLSEMRYGFYRANVTFPVPIMFGLYFAMFGAICAAVLKSSRKYETLYGIGLLIMCIGVFSSFSSGPWVAAMLAVFFIVFYRWRRHWKIAAGLIAMVSLCVEIISNRHFYDVLGGFALSVQTAWYRSRLISVALFEGGMSGHWLTGGPSGIAWAASIDGRKHVDIVNHYILILYLYGLTGLIPFLCMTIAAVKKLIQSFKICVSESDKWIVWCLSGGMFGVLLAVLSVSLFGQPLTVFYMMLGLCGSIPLIIRRPEFYRLNSMGHSQRNEPKLLNYLNREA